jgi:hypothetical protein
MDELCFVQTVGQERIVFMGIPVMCRVDPIPFYILEYRMILCYWYVSVTKLTLRLMRFGLAYV